MMMGILAWSFVSLVAYTCVGYPLLLGALAAVRRRPVRRAPITPSISLVISAYLEEDVIAGKIENSLALDYPRDRLEIIVASDGATDGTAAIAERYRDRGVTVLHSPQRQGKAAAMNRGAAHARGEILVFSDANAMYQPDALRMLARNFADPAVGCVSGRKAVRRHPGSVGESETVYWSYDCWIRAQETRLGSTTAVVGEMLAIRASLFPSIPGDGVTDDLYLAVRVLQAGHRVVYEAEAVSWESGAPTLADEMMRRQRIAAGRARILFDPAGLWPWRQPLALGALISHKFLRLLLPFLMLGAFLSSAAVTASADPHRVLGLALGAQAVCYASAAVGRFAPQGVRALRWPRLAHYIVAGNVASALGVLAYLRGARPIMWQRARRSPG